MPRPRSFISTAAGSDMGLRLAATRREERSNEERVLESRESGSAGVDAAARAESLLMGGLISFCEAAGCQFQGLEYFQRVLPRW